MKPTMYNLLTLSATLLLAACSDTPHRRVPQPDKPGSETSAEISLTPFCELNRRPAAVNSHAADWRSSILKMDYRSYIRLNENIGAEEPRYPRIRTLRDGRYMLTWQKRAWKGTNNGADTYYSFSEDLKMWNYARNLWKSHDVTNAKGGVSKRLYTNANTLQLSNGELLAVASFWNNATYTDIDCKADHGIVVKRSRDNGATWFAEKIIYNGPCWEPHPIELPSGEIQCFFSESRPWTSGSHSGTDMVLSTNGGESWEPAVGSDAYRVMRKTWWNEPLGLDCYTFQMPVGVVLNDSKQFAFAMESCRYRTVADGRTTDRFGIDMVYSDESGAWRYLEGDEVLPESQYKEIEYRAVAPYLIQFPSGETLLAYAQWSDSKKIAEQRMRLGNAAATEFGESATGIPGYCVWGGLDLSSSHSVLSCMGTSDGADSGEIAVARFNLNHGITATRRTVKADGDNSEWKETDDALFVGAQCQAQATLRCSADEHNLYLLVEVLDETLSANDFATILLSAESESGDMGPSARRIRVGYDGLAGTDQWAASWRKCDMGAEAQTVYDGTPGDNKDTDHGFFAEISIPRSSLEIGNGCLRVNFGYFDSAANAEDMLADADRVCGWLTVDGL